MKRGALNRSDYLFILIIALLLGFSSCRTVREVPVEAIKPVSTGKLLRKAEKNALNYKDFAINRINCHFSGNNTNSNFRIKLKAKRDEKILLSISKINIPLGRVLLTPDSVRYVNYIERNYFVDDYAFLRRIFNMDLDFYTVQSLISNDLFLYTGQIEDHHFNNFNLAVEDGHYVLTSGSTNNSQSDKKSKYVKKRGLNSGHQNSTLHQKMYFDPVTYSLMKLILYDEGSDRKINIAFDDFIKIRKNDFPGSIDFEVISDIEEIRLKIRMNGFSTDIIDSIDLSIPEKYEQIRIN